MKIPYLLFLSVFLLQYQVLAKVVSIPSVCGKFYLLPSVKVIPNPIILNYGISKPNKDDRVVDHRHAFGTTVYVISKDQNSIQIREVQKTGELRSILEISIVGVVSYIDLEFGFQNTKSMPAEMARNLIFGLKSNLDQGDFAFLPIGYTLKKIVGPYDRKEEHSKNWARSARLPVPLEKIAVSVGITRGHAFGTDKLNFFPNGSGILIEKFDRSNARTEAILLLPDGQISRQIDNGTEMIAHIPSDVAEGLIKYLYHLSALNESYRTFNDARDFLLAAAPELHVNELKRLKGHFFIEQSDGTLAQVNFNNTPKAFDPKKGLKQREP